MLTNKGRTFCLLTYVCSMDSISKKTHVKKNYRGHRSEYRVLVCRLWYYCRPSSGYENRDKHLSPAQQDVAQYTAYY